MRQALLTKTHQLQDSTIYHQILANKVDDVLESYYSVNKPLTAADLKYPATIKAAISPELDVHIQESALESLPHELSIALMQDFIACCKSKQISSISVVLSPDEAQDKLKSLYSNLGFANFEEAEGFITGVLTLEMQ